MAAKPFFGGQLGCPPPSVPQPSSDLVLIPLPVHLLCSPLRAPTADRVILFGASNFH